MVLIDAGSTLTEEDVRTIRALQEAAIPAHILLSKADLLDRPDCEKTIGYITQHIASGTGLSLPVHPVSVHPSHRKLLDRWLGEEILPVMSHSQDLRTASLQRKIGALQESLVYSLQNQIRRNRHTPAGNAETFKAVEIRLRRATGLIVETTKACREKADAMDGKVFETWIAAAAGATNNRPGDADRKIPAEDAIRTALLQTVQGGIQDIREQIETLARSLQDELVKSAADLVITDVPGDNEFLLLVRDMPAFDPGTIQVTVPAYLFTALRQNRLGKSCWNAGYAGSFPNLPDWSLPVTSGSSRNGQAR